MTKMDGDVTLITGASSGIGDATARAFAAEGATVALVSRRRERLETVAAELEGDHGVETLVLPTDVSNHSEVEDAVDETVNAFGGLDVLVNNAGVAGPGTIDEVSIQEYRRLMDVNVDGMFYMARTALPYLRESKGTLVFVGSFAGQYPRPGNAIYAASKWWTRGFAYSLAGTVGSDDVAVSIVNPTETRTEIGSDDEPPMRERFDAGEVTEPEAIAEAITFAATRAPADSAQEIDLYRRDKFEGW